MSSFVHLHTHSHYSLLNALPMIKELVAAAKENGMSALALTDNGNLYGAVEFYEACKKEDIKPIIGIDAYLAPRTRHDREAQIDKPRARIVLLAKNTNGYKNLIKMVTDSYLTGFYYRPRLDRELIEQYKDDLICIIPSFAGETSHALKAGDRERAHTLLSWYKSQFGDDCYLEITHHPEIPGHMELQAQIREFAGYTNTPLVAAHDVYYLSPEDRLARETMVKIQTGGTVETTDGFDEHEEDFSFISQEKAYEYFKDIPEALENTAKIADMCNVEIEIGKWYFPDYIIESDKSPDDELSELAYKGISWRGLDPEDPVIKERTAYELDIIKMKGYAKYFLVVGDLLREARERKILTTIRGSVAGSLTTYVLGITNVNPLEYKLPFERFLNPERPSAPDVDMDYADNRRDEIIEYAKQKYGADKVAQIGTFGKMLARAVVRDVARALNYPYSTGDRIAKLIPMGSQGFPMTINRALEIEPELKELYTKDPETREIIDLAKKIEGRARHVGVHAAGVVIAPAPLTDFVPLQYEPKSDKDGGGNLITQYDMHSVGEDGVGLLKFDFLGIKNLSILADAVDRVRAVRHIEVDIENIPLDDKKTFEMLARGETMGLFQLNGSGMTHFLKDLRPSSIHDINAMVALYRPGPMESIPQYIERKHNPHLISYLDKRLEKILDRSYGVVTYQDDVLMISRELAGYSWLEADMLRKAMGKKIPKVMAAEKEKLLKGFVEYGKLSPDKAERLWKLIEPFAAYGFNKCLPASARVLDAESGVPTTVGKLLTREQGFAVYALSHDQKVVEAQASRPFENGVKMVYRLKTRSGRVIRATGNHPLYAWDGWTELSKLKAGMRVAVPRRLPAPRHPTPLASHEASALGYLLSEGNLCHPNGVSFYSTQEDELQDFIAAAEQFFNTKTTIDRSKSAASVYSGKKNQKEKNGLFDWIKMLGLHDRRATEKYVPDIVFSSDNPSVARFLGKLWQGDGCINVDNYQVFYATSSRRLADDVQHLLLRFGIVSTIHTKSFKYRGGRKEGWTIVVSGYENLTSFHTHIGEHLIGEKRAALQRLIERSTVRTNNLGRGTPDTVPAAILSTIRIEMALSGITTRILATTTGLSERTFGFDACKRGFTRPTVARIGAALHSPYLAAHAQSDIFWDEVVSIEEDGKEMTYDLSVPGPENFIADNFFVHNSHAASYGRVAYQTAYMKANFPVEYMSAVLTADSGNIEKISEIIHECERMGIEILPPDINESFAGFSVVPSMDGKKIIRFGLTTIKNFGEGIAESIIRERKANGPYTSLADFLTRVQDKNLNKKSLEALIMAGTLDRFNERGLMMANIDYLLEFNREQSAQKASAHDSLFAGLVADVAATLTLKPTPPAPASQKLLWEKELLGVFVSGHPLDSCREAMKKYSRIYDVVSDEREGIPVTTAGLVEDVKQIMTKKGEHMAFIRLADWEHSIEMVVFPGLLKEKQALFQPQECIAVKGRLSYRNGQPSIVAEKAKSLV